MSARAAIVTALAVWLVLLRPLGAWAQPGGDLDPSARFDAAMAMVSAEPARAVDDLLALAQAAPDAPIAPDALLLAARTVEERLHAPARALALYDRLVARYPDARARKAAARRAAVLRSLLGSGGQHAELAAELAALQAEAADQLTAAQRARVIALADAAWPGAVDAGLWLADVDARAGAIDRARARLADLTARTAGTERAGDVLRAATALAIRAGDVVAAERLLGQLGGQAAADAGAAPADQVVVVELRDALEHARARQRLARIAVGIAVVGAVLLLASLVTAAGGARPALRALRPPIDVWYLAPVLGVMVLAAATGFVGIGRAVALIASAGLAVTWLSGAALTAAAARSPGRRSPRRAVLHAVLAPTVVLAVATAVLATGDLADLVVATLRDGPDR